MCFDFHIVGDLIDELPLINDGHHRVSALQSPAFLNSPCFQYIRKKRLTFCEISIGVNFIIFFPRNDEKSDF